MIEEWKFYKETYNKRWGKRVYYVSNYGRVKINGELYICPIFKDGYYYLCGKLLHRIIAEKFLPDYYENCEIDHKDCNKLNNMVTNLLVCHNRKENMANPLTRQHLSKSHIGQIPWNYNKPNAYTEESKQKMSKSQKLTLYKHKRDEKGRFC